MRMLLKVLMGLLLIGLLFYFCTEFLLELWWYRSLKLEQFFLLRESYEGSVNTTLTLVVAGLFYLNFFIIPRLLGNDLAGSRFGVLAFLQKRHKSLGVLSVLFSVLILSPIYPHWEQLLLYFYAVPSELVDPVYNKNISYYFFSYPIYTFVQQELLLFFAILFALTSYCYFLYTRKQQQKLPVTAKFHLALLLFVLVMLQAWSIALERIEMLYESRHLPVFYGPGFVELNYFLPLIYFSFLVFLMAASATVYSLYTGKKFKLALGLMVSYFVVFAFKQLDVIPNFIDDYYVKPSPVNTESQSIAQHIKATSDAFKLSHVTEIDYPLKPFVTPLSHTEIKQQLSNIPLWDDDLILPVFEQLQSIRPYFSFYQVAVDRYKINGKHIQVNLAARELDYQGVSDDAKNWRNNHLIYTHGNGLVMSPSSQLANRPMQWLLHNFGQGVAIDKFKLTQPEIYYGLADYPYAIVPNTESLNAEHEATSDMSTDYKGSGGLAMTSLLSKAVVSAFLTDERIFFSTAITDKSRILVRRNIFKRVHEIAPFLVLDEEPYPVVVGHKLYWIMDAYTKSDRYPLVEPRVLAKTAKKGDYFNYARNSVKIIVDAYNGSVDFYVVDNKDPIVKTYQAIYPSLFKDMADVPDGFVKHFSYPKDWLALQIKLYGRFHQKDPEIFYQQSEAIEASSMSGEVISPYFLTINMAKNKTEDNTKFVLLSPLSPVGRDNLDSVLMAGCLKALDCQSQYHDDIYVYKFSKEIQVEGPEQISALMDQNPEISKQLSLWNQHGSKVIRGRIIIVPIKQSLLYIQPLYLLANATQGFPKLAKIAVTMNRESAMADSLELAFERLQEKIIPVIESENH